MMVCLCVALFLQFTAEEERVCAMAGLSLILEGTLALEVFNLLWSLRLSLVF